MTLSIHHSTPMTPSGGSLIWLDHGTAKNDCHAASPSLRWLHPLSTLPMANTMTPAPTCSTPVTLEISQGLRDPLDLSLYTQEELRSFNQAYLTIEEASDLTGFSRSYVRMMMEHADMEGVKMFGLALDADGTYKGSTYQELKMCKLSALIWAASKKNIPDSQKNYRRAGAEAGIYDLDESLFM